MKSEIKENNHNRIAIIIIIMCILLFLSVSSFIALTTFFNIKNNSDLDNRRVLNSDKVMSILEKEGCIVEDLSSEMQTSIYYQTKEKSCQYEVTYVVIDNEQKINKIKDEFYSKSKNSNDIKFDNSRSLEYSLEKHVFGGDQYNIVLSNKVMLLYLKTDLSNRKDAIKMLTSFGFKSSYFN